MFQTTLWGLTLNHQRRSCAGPLLLLLLLIPATATAGIFSTLSKLGKSLDNAHIDLPLHKLNIPDHIKDLSPAAIKPGPEGEWKLVQADGIAAPLDKLLKQPSGGSNKIAFVINIFDLPRSMAQFDRLPKNIPLFIQGKKGRLYEFHRGKAASLTYKKVRLPVTNLDEIRDVLWMLQRPSFGRAVHFARLDGHSTSPLPLSRYSSSYSIETTTADQLLSSMRTIKNQTLVLSGRIVDGKLNGVGSRPQGVSLQKLQQAAAENDVRLVILESDKPELVLKKVANSMQSALQDPKHLHDTTGDFISRLADPSSPNMLELHISHNGDNQMAIQMISTKEISPDGPLNVTGTILKHMPAHLILQSTRIVMPDQGRSRELDARLIPGISSWIPFYLIVSAVLGFITPGTSWKLWRKLWILGRRSEYRNLFVFLGLWLLHRTLFVILFIPLFGLFSFVWLVVSWCYMVFNFILLRPIGWLYQRF